MHIPSEGREGFVGTPWESKVRSAFSSSSDEVFSAIESWFGVAEVSDRDVEVRRVALGATHRSAGTFLSSLVGCHVLTLLVETHVGPSYTQWHTRCGVKTLLDENRC